MSEIDVVESNVAGKGQVSFSQYKKKWNLKDIIANADMKAAVSFSKLKTNWWEIFKFSARVLLFVGYLIFLIIVLTGCTPNTVYLQHPKTEILEPERCVKAGNKLIAEKFEYKIEGDKFIIDKPNLAILATNIAQLKNAYEELKVCYTNQVDYYVQVANL
jgi:hypothetical protein